MSELGLGVMINMLGGNTETVEAIKKGIGQTIFNVVMADDQLVFTFLNGYVLALWDDGQTCCENRYMTTDDILLDFVGSTLVDFEIADGGETEDEYGEPHEIQFLKVTTSLGVFTCETHNEHNGYYGGFWIKAKGDNKNVG